MTDVCLVLTSCADRGEAERIARELVQTQSAACVNILPGVLSIYRWLGAVESADEVLLIVKTRGDRVDEVQAVITRLHSYELPECLVIPVASGSGAYLRWIAESVR